MKVSNVVIIMTFEIYIETLCLQMINICFADFRCQNILNPIYE